MEYIWKRTVSWCCAENTTRIFTFLGWLRGDSSHPLGVTGSNNTLSQELRAPEILYDRMLGIRNIRSNSTCNVWCSAQMGRGWPFDCSRTDKMRQVRDSSRRWVEGVASQQRGPVGELGLALLGAQRQVVGWGKEGDCGQLGSLCWTSSDSWYSQSCAGEFRSGPRTVCNCIWIVLQLYET